MAIADHDHFSAGGAQAVDERCVVAVAGCEVETGDLLLVEQFHCLDGKQNVDRVLVGCHPALMDGAQVVARHRFDPTVVIGE